MVGREDLLDDPDLNDDLARADHADKIDDVMIPWCRKRTNTEAIAQMETARIPAGPALSPQQVLEDPHIRERKLLIDMPFPGAPKPIPIANTPIRLSATPAAVRTRAPLTGEHTDEILTELGFSPEEIENLRQAEAV